MKGGFRKRNQSSYMLKIKASKDDSEGLVGTLVEKMENFELSRYSLYGKKVIEDNV